MISEFMQKFVLPDRIQSFSLSDGLHIVWLAVRLKHSPFRCQKIENGFWN